ncbi:MAG: accessory gene regulator B family protein [Coprococcus sp.]|nr:accessory gene regulator B family protein [Coprococcus sp.]
MISRLTNWLIKQDAISEQDALLYSYAITHIIMAALPIVIVFLLSCISGNLINFLFIIIPFVSIRRYSGGYHAPSAPICLICSCILLIISVTLSNIINVGVMLHGIILISIIILTIVSPISSANKPIEEYERNIYKRNLILILLFFGILYFICVCIGPMHSAESLAVGIILPAILQLPCILTKHEQ